MIGISLSVSNLTPGYGAKSGGGGPMPPAVQAGGPYSGEELQPIPLNTATVLPGSDLNPVILWTEVTSLGGTFSPNASTVNATFTPAQAGAYVLQLSADANDFPPVVDTANLESTAIVVIPPTVDAGGPYAGTVDTPIQLDATVIPGTDPSPVILWTIEAGSPGTGTFTPNASTVDAIFTPDTVGIYTLKLSADPDDDIPTTDSTSLDSQAVITFYLLMTNNDTWVTESGDNLIQE